MKTNKISVAILCLLTTGLLAATSASFSQDLSQGTQSVIKVAPPAPSFDQKMRHAELAARRARVAQSIGPKSALILFSAQPRVYAGDVDYEYRQENNFYYLTNLKQKRATLVMLPGNAATPEILFMPRRIPALESWNGHMYSAAEASELSGLKEIWEASEFEPFIKALRAHEAYRPKPGKILMSSATAAGSAPTSGHEQLFAAAATNEAVLYLLVPGVTESNEYRQEQRFAADWAMPASGFTVRNVSPVFTHLRQRKSAMEIAFMQHAMDITAEAHQRAWVAAGAAKWEYEIDALVAYTFRLRNADHWGYPSILGCGPNATTLHYDELQGPCKPGDLMLMDIGAEFEHYSADVTRTVPVNGKFSPAQAEVYQAVFDAQEKAASVIRPGVLISDVDRAATEVLKSGLLKMGLITDRNSNQFRLWFMHGTCHWLGMNVHDVGNFGAKLEPGMVFTNEPGIYVRTDALDYQPFGMSDVEWEKFRAAVRPAFEKYKGIGVRIEDDMLVTTDGVTWMTAALPRSIEDIEKFFERARGQVRSN